jgi:integrase
MQKIWFRKSKKAYYLQIDRHTQKRLGKTKAEADAAYRQWLIEEGQQLPQAEQKKLTVAEVAQEFLNHCQKHTKKKSYEFYAYFIVPLVERFGGAVAKDLSPLAFEKWLDDHKGWKGARRNAIVASKRMFNWAVNDAKLLPESPLKGVKRPPKKRRKRIFTPAEQEYLFRTIRDEQFREYVFAMLDTGARPMEVAGVSAANVSRDGAKWIFDEHKTDRSGEARIVYLSPAMQELTKKLMALYPDGPFFRSTRKFGGVRRPWSPNGIRCRFKRLREKAARERAKATPEEREKIPDLKGITAYVCRHTFTTSALTEAGLSVPVVAALLGHKSIRQVDETYNHTDQVTGQLKEAAAKAAQASRA